VINAVTHFSDPTLVNQRGGARGRGGSLPHARFVLAKRCLAYYQRSALRKASRPDRTNSRAGGLTIS
jgi:hypothetical protein